ncbi:tetratricopeptide repeat protein [Amycolatopsis sp. NPDC059657]|uniref:tetratricopeptide repeat protein n=1 Tax=Amycolatopsis sp. NPDC059657 TaxID=3346899 RepID=UPI00366DBF12
MSDEQLWERLWAAERLPHGKGQIAAFEEVLRRADAEGSPEIQYAVRIFITSAYQQGGEPAKAFVPFSWCLAMHDRGEADSRWDSNLLWYFKFMVSSMTNFPEIPLERTYAVLDDMERRYRLAGHTMNPVHQHRESVARHLGDKETAAEQYRLWNASPRGEMSDCVGCEPDSKVAHLKWLGRHEEAVQLAEPVLAGTLTCSEQPHSMQSSLLLAYVHTGRLAEAASAHRQAYRAIRTQPAYLYTVAEHIEFCALTGNPGRALELIERHLGWLAEAPTPMAEMTFCAMAALALRVVAESGHADAAIERPDGPVSAGDLLAELTSRALAVAARFDARNGNSTQSSQIQAILDARPLLDRLPLSGPMPSVPEPVAVSYPDSPAELATLAEHQFMIDDNSASAVTWARFDELLPAPEGDLLARRLVAAGSLVVNEDRDAAGRHWTRAAEVYRELGNEVRYEAVRARLGLLSCFAGEGLDDLTASVERLAGLGDAEQYAWSLLRLAQAALVTGDPDRAMATLDEARKPAEEADIPLLTAQLVNQTAEFSAALGEELTIESIELLEDAAERFRAAGAPIRATGATHTLARLKAAFGDVEAAYGLFPQVIADFTAFGNPLAAAQARVDFGGLCLRADRPEEAADALEDAISVLSRLEADISQPQFLLAKAYRELRQPDQALELLDEVAALCLAQENQAGAGQMHDLSGEILDELDRDAQAAESFTRAADLFAESGFSVDELRTRRRATLSWHWARDQDRSLAALAVADALAATLPAEDPQTLWEHSMLNYDASRILANFDRPAEALPRIVKATEGFVALEALTEVAIAGSLHGRILRDLDRPAEARAVLTDALAALPAEATHQRAQLQALLDDLTP